MKSSNHMHQSSRARWIGSFVLGGLVVWTMLGCSAENDPHGSAGAGPGVGGAAGSAGNSGAGNAGTGGAAGAAGQGTAGSAGSGNSTGGSGGLGSGGTGGAAGSGTAGVGGAGTSGTGGTGGQTLPPVTDYAQPGPFPATTVNSTGPNSQYTMFRPRTLGENGFKHSPLTWGNGIITTPSNYTAFLTNVASHGFVVIASNSTNVTQQLMTDGLDWLIAQNGAAGDFQGKLDVTRAVSMGYSIGGTAAVRVGAHASVITTVSIHGHTAQSALHGPLLQTTGTADTSGVPLQQATFDQSTVQTFLATLEGATHFEILSAAGGREGAPIVAWLRLWVYNDQGARKFFYGDDCSLCVAPWTNPQRKLWQ